MTDASATVSESDSETSKQTGDVHHFARRALLFLAADESQRRRPVAADLLGQFLNALRTCDVSRIDGLIKTFIASGLREDQIVFDYIPAAARVLGDDWVADRMSWTDVSVAAARLQGIVHQLSRNWVQPDGAAKCCLVIVPEGEQHTLGATVLAARLRSQGIEAQLELNAYAPLMGELVSSRDFAAVMITSCDTGHLENLKNLVQKLRSGNKDVPILIGGNVLEQSKDVCRRIGADHATRSWEEALRICNLKTPQGGYVAGVRRP